ncbi:MAG TPA: N-methyl-L-tryptophan oxidase [Rubrobacteraceae bacterium]|nr:N-methyl-L-tryptophan oxidase [Rubrobacteraceae bacterium]
MTSDVIVAGLGGMGSAAAYHLAGRGKRVLGLERFSPVHDRGSSHGRSRIIRQAYFEGAEYVPLLLRAYELWERLERETGQELMTLTGGLMIGREEGELVSGSVASADEHGLPYELLDAREIRRRFPAYAPSPQTVALYEKNAGFVRPEESVRAHLDRAASLGADLRFEEPVLSWEATGSGVRVETPIDSYEAERLVISPGAWAPRLLADLGLPLEVTRQVMFWFEPVDGLDLFLPERFPIFIWEPDDGNMFYGFPAQDDDSGVKAAFFRAGGVPTDPETIDREVREEEVDFLRGYLAEHVPDLAGRCLDAKACMYTNTPDEHFVISPHPEHLQVAVACGFSGHGYKFCGVVGEILADLATEGSTRHPIDLFSPARLQGADARG